MLQVQVALCALLWDCVCGRTSRTYGIAGCGGWLKDEGDSLLAYKSCKRRGWISIHKGPPLSSSSCCGWARNSCVYTSREPGRVQKGEGVIEVEPSEKVSSRRRRWWLLRLKSVLLDEWIITVIGRHGGVVGAAVDGTVQMGQEG